MRCLYLLRTFVECEQKLLTRYGEVLLVMFIVVQFFYFGIRKKDFCESRSRVFGILRFVLTVIFWFFGCWLFLILEFLFLRLQLVVFDFSWQFLGEVSVFLIWLVDSEECEYGVSMEQCGYMQRGLTNLVVGGKLWRFYVEEEGMRMFIGLEERRRVLFQGL